MTRYAVGRGWAVLVLALAALGPAAAEGNAALELQDQLIKVSDQVKPAVVSITVERDAPVADVPSAPVPLPTPPGRSFGVARGTGMIYREADKYYYILTNAHVVRFAHGQHVKVQIVAEREERDGTVVGTPDTRTDTAVVRIDRRPDDKLRSVAIGKVGDLRAGSFVIAVGTPFGFQWSISFGVVSGLDRELDEPSGEAGNRPPVHYRGLIQTDASINPGNSGGPLVNLRGEVVGVNFAIYSPGAGGNVGVGFAIPIDRATRSADDIIANGRVRRGFLGVSVNDLEDAAKSQKATLDEMRRLLGVDAGAYVASVAPNTPAARAGLLPTDVIVAVNGEAVDSSGALVDRVSILPPGSEVTLDVVRNNQRLPVKLQLGELPAEVAGTEPTVTPPRPVRDPWGLRVVPLPPEKARELPAPSQQGVLVAEIAPNSPLAARGVAADTILLSARTEGQTFVFDSVETYQKFVDAASKNGALVALVYAPPAARDGGLRLPQSAVVRMPKAGEAPAD